MRARVESLSPRVLTGIAIGVVLLYVAVAWCLVVSPKRADAGSSGVATRTWWPRLCSM